MPKAYIILKAAATALIAAACAQGPLHLSKSLWVAGRWASSEARSFRAIPGLDPAQTAPPEIDSVGPRPASP
jgi:hypothetical protein